jgi:DNA primase
MLQVALSAFGGGLSAWSQRIVVEQKRWMSDEEFLTGLTVARLFPGPNQINMAVYIGANFRGLCPFHGETSPSFSVSPTKQFYHCFGCGVNGNAIGFLMEHAGMGFVEAVTDLSQQVGLAVPQDDASPQERERAAQLRRQQATLSDVLEKAAQAYIQNLKASPRAIQYLKGRGLSGQIAKTFGLGFSPEGWRTLASTFPDYSDEQLVSSG